MLIAVMLIRRSIMVSAIGLNFPGRRRNEMKY